MISPHSVCYSSCVLPRELSCRAAGQSSGLEHFRDSEKETIRSKLSSGVVARMLKLLNYRGKNNNEDIWIICLNITFRNW